jgi:O-antigen ligase
MKQYKLETIFDQASFAILAFVLFCSICLTFIAKAVLLWIVPLVFVIKKFFFAAKMRDLIKDKFVLINVILILILPLLSSFIHGDKLNQNSHWLNASNSWVVLWSLFAGAYFLRLQEKFPAPLNSRLLIPLLIGISFSLDFSFAIIANYRDLFHYRWEGSGNNPNIWSVQAAIVLLVLLIFKSKYTSLRFIIPLASSAIVFSGSYTGIIGLLVALVFWMLRVNRWFFVLFCFLIVLINLALLFATAKFDLNLPVFLLDWSSKLIPRFKIWSNVLDFFNSLDFNIWLGTGYENYIYWADTLLKKHHDHIHNAYFHYFALYGIPGLCLNFAWIFKLGFEYAGQKAAKYKLLATAMVYILSVCCADCSFFFYENQILFWLLLPLLL